MRNLHILQHFQGDACYEILHLFTILRHMRSLQMSMKGIKRFPLLNDSNNLGIELLDSGRGIDVVSGRILQAAFFCQNQWNIDFENFQKFVPSVGFDGDCSQYVNYLR